jgi:hypothetical protein
MASQSKSDAARENGKKSRGPVTNQGKENSSRNALKHGLTAESAVLPGESEQDFAELLQAHKDTYQPANAMEMELVRTMALARWRLRRIAALESGLFENELALSEDEFDEKFDSISDLARLAYVFQKQTQPLSLLLRYESSVARLHDRTYKHLKELRNEPKEPPCVSMRTDASAPVAMPDNDGTSNPMRQLGVIPVPANFDISPSPLPEPRLDLRRYKASKGTRPSRSRGSSHDRLPGRVRSGRRSAGVLL